MQRCKECGCLLTEANTDFYQGHCRQCGGAKRSRSDSKHYAARTSYFADHWCDFGPELYVRECDVWAPPPVVIENTRESIPAAKLEERLAAERRHDPSCVVATKRSPPPLDAEYLYQQWLKERS